MSTAALALLFSGLSVAIASFALGWNIYRDILAKPRVRVRMGLRQLVMSGEAEFPLSVWIRALNLGPGKTTLELIIVKRSSLRRLLTRSGEFGFVKFEGAMTQGSSLPIMLEVGEHADFILPCNRDSFLGKSFIELGIRDVHGRIHWAPRKDMREARKNWLTELHSIHKDQ
jgi:hypothetical protein